MLDCLVGRVPGESGSLVTGPLRREGVPFP